MGRGAAHADKRSDDKIANGIAVELPLLLLAVVVAAAIAIADAVVVDEHYSTWNGRCVQRCFGPISLNSRVAGVSRFRTRIRQLFSTCLEKCKTNACKLRFAVFFILPSSYTDIRGKNVYIYKKKKVDGRYLSTAFTVQSIHRWWWSERRRV